nr:MAG TPA: hypothetical protein [Caudoviricetes sp.]
MFRSFNALFISHPLFILFLFRCFVRQSLSTNT